jgi:hypothetical protein
MNHIAIYPNFSAATPVKILARQNLTKTIHMEPQIFEKSEAYLKQTLFD